MLKVELAPIAGYQIDSSTVAQAALAMWNTAFRRCIPRFHDATCLCYSTVPSKIPCACGSRPENQNTFEKHQEIYIYIYIIRKHDHHIIHSEMWKILTTEQTSGVSSLFFTELSEFPGMPLPCVMRCTVCMAARCVRNIDLNHSASWRLGSCERWKMTKSSMNEPKIGGNDMNHHEKWHESCMESFPNPFWLSKVSVFSGTHNKMVFCWRPRPL